MSNTPVDPLAGATETDVVDALIGAPNHTERSPVRAFRAKIADAVQASFGALFVDEPASNLPLSLRFMCGAVVAEHSGDSDLARYYRSCLSSAAPEMSTASETSGSPELSELFLSATASAANAKLAERSLDYARRIALDPESGGPNVLAELREAGLTTRDIVTLAQLIGYVSFQARLTLALRALSGQERLHASEQSNLPVVSHGGFTAEKLEWQSWLTALPVDQASPEQLAVLDESGPTSRTSAYYLTLIHNPEVLRQRSSAYNAIMYAPGGLSRTERELGALVVSTLNGCPYCASVHAQRLIQLSKSSALVEAVFADPQAAGSTDRERALVRYAKRLSLDVADFGMADVAALRAVDLTDQEVADYSHTVAIFAWANRLMQTLGEPAGLPGMAQTPAGANHA